MAAQKTMTITKAQEAIAYLDELREVLVASAEYPAAMAVRWATDAIKEVRDQHIGESLLLDAQEAPHD